MVEQSDKKSQNVQSIIRPSLPVAGTSTNPGVVVCNENDPKEPPQESWRKRCFRCIYDREKKQFCGRTCKSWFCIIVYSIMYLIFLSTYTLIFLFGSLTIIKLIDDYQMIEKTELLTYSINGVGLSATPTSLNNMPLIWYRNDSQDYKKYIDGLEILLSKRRKREINSFTELGPCGVSPYGYGSNPCVIIRINKQLKWSAEPFNVSSLNNVNFPVQVQEWLKLEKQKLWLHCDGVHAYDKEHIGKITYYPDPPGFDPEMFPLNKNSNSPLIAVQISGFTLGVSLAVQCKLWYKGGVSTTDFLLYVTPRRT